MVAVYDSGIQDSADELSNMMKMEMKSFDLSGFKVTMRDPHTAIVAYVCKMEGSVDTQDVSGTYNCASVWQMKQGAWHAVFHTDVKAAAGAMPDARKKSNRPAGSADFSWRPRVTSGARLSGSRALTSKQRPLL